MDVHCHAASQQLQPQTAGHTVPVMVRTLLHLVDGISSVRYFVTHATDANKGLDIISGANDLLTEEARETWLATVQIPILSALLAAGCRVVSQTDSTNILEVPEDMYEVFRVSTERFIVATAPPKNSEHSAATAVKFARRIVESGEKAV